jgi:hypothetical protein
MLFTLLNNPLQHNCVFNTLGALKHDLTCVFSLVQSRHYCMHLFTGLLVVVQNLFMWL